MYRSTTPPARLGVDPDAVHEAFAAGRWAGLSDEQLFDLAAAVVSIPKPEPASSFILHAPLELLARRALLRLVAPNRRDPVRERMLWVAATYEGAAEGIDPANDRTFDDPGAARSELLAATEASDLDRVDAAATWLGRNASADDVMAIADAVVGSLAAAGHGSIYFFHLGRTATHSRAALGLFRPLAREIARFPQLRIEWIDEGVEAHGSDPARFAAALAGAPRLGLPGSDFIFPTVHQVDSGGQARDIIAASLPADLGAAGNAIRRVAAASMLQDDPAFAPYGWTHCLTLPQAVLGILPWLENATAASAIAATYVVGFRAAESSRAIEANWEPERSEVDPIDALGADPHTAAGAVYHAPNDALDAIVAELAARAAAHEDAHLAKYTLACFDAGVTAPQDRRLFLAAAAYLGAWWATQ